MVVILSTRLCALVEPPVVVDLEESELPLLIIERCRTSRCEDGGLAGLPDGDSDLISHHDVIVTYPCFYC